MGSERQSGSEDLFLQSIQQLKLWDPQAYKTVAGALGFLTHQTEVSRSLLFSPSHRRKFGKTLLASMELVQRKFGFGPLISAKAQIAGTDTFLSSEYHVFDMEQENKIHFKKVKDKRNS